MHVTQSSTCISALSMQGASKKRGAAVVQAQGDTHPYTLNLPLLSTFVAFVLCHGTRVEFVCRRGTSVLWGLAKSRSVG